MINLLKYIILLILIIGAGLYIYISQYRVSDLSPSGTLSLSTKSYNKNIYYQKNSGDPSVIKSVQVTKDEPKLLELRVIYTYDGTEGSEVSTCGGVIKQDMDYSSEWSCMPTRLKKGENTVLYRLELLDNQPADYYCTDSVRVNMYKHGGMDFFNQLYTYKKTWTKGEGFYAQFKQLVYGYIECT